MTDASRNRTVLGPECKINGDLTLDSDVLVVGAFTGTLRVSGTLEVAESAQIDGVVITDTLRSAGTIQADVVAATAVELSPSAVLTGRVYTQQLAVADGGTFEGQITIGGHAMEMAREVTAANPPAPKKQAAQVDTSEADHGQSHAGPSVQVTNGEGVLRRRSAAFGQPRMAGAGQAD